MPRLLTRGKRRRRNRLQGGRLHLGTLAGITSERWPTSDRNRWPASVGICTSLFAWFSCGPPCWTTFGDGPPIDVFGASGLGPPPSMVQNLPLKWCFSHPSSFRSLPTRICKMEFDAVLVLDLASNHGVRRARRTLCPSSVRGSGPSRSPHELDGAVPTPLRRGQGWRTPLAMSSPRRNGLRNMTDRAHALVPFDPLVGNWATEATQPAIDALVPVTTSFEWLVSGHLLIQQPVAARAHAGRLAGRP